MKWDGGKGMGEKKKCSPKLRWYWTGRPGVLQFMWSQRVGHDWATELNWTELNQGWNPYPLQWKHRVLTTGLPETSWWYLIQRTQRSEDHKYLEIQLYLEGHGEGKIVWENTGNSIKLLRKYQPGKFRISPSKWRTGCDPLHCRSLRQGLIT